MNDFRDEIAALLELEARHDDLLRRLDELDKRIEQVLSDYAKEHTSAGGVSLEAVQRAA
jgi:uncharacterized protein YdcH (DUF465 family)